MVEASAMPPASLACNCGSTLRPVATQSAAEMKQFPPFPSAGADQMLLHQQWQSQLQTPSTYLPQGVPPAGAFGQAPGFGVTPNPVAPFTTLAIPAGMDLSQLHPTKATIISEVQEPADLPVTYNHSMELQQAVPTGSLIPTNVRPPQNIVAAGLGPAEVPAMLTGSPFFHAAPSAPQCPLLSPEAPTLAYLQPIVQQQHMQKLLQEQKREAAVLVTPQQEIQRVMNVEAQKQANGVRMIQNRVLAQEPSKGFGVITVPNGNAPKYNQMMEQMKQTLEATGQMEGPIPRGIKLCEMLQNMQKSGMTEFIASRNQHANDAINLCRRWRGLPTPPEEQEKKADEAAEAAPVEEKEDTASESSGARDASVPELQAPSANWESLSIKDLCVVSAPHPSVLRQMRAEQQAEAANAQRMAEQAAAQGNNTQTQPSTFGEEERNNLERLLEAQNQRVSYLEQLLEQQRSAYYLGYGGYSDDVAMYSDSARDSSDFSAASTASYQETPAEYTEPAEAAAPKLIQRKPNVGGARTQAGTRKATSAKASTRASSKDSVDGTKEGDVDDILRRFVAERAAAPVEQCLRRVQKGVYFLGDLKVLVKKAHNGDVLCMAQHAVLRQRGSLGEYGKKFIPLDRFWARLCKGLEKAA
ncbi:hypothetical protein BESB_076830 [Besnoitia besnoiti]|uniref:Uncharacterized protein n=1 Tax=Besnoitia besnoiti TaxID=94643 RepID=A0A2A9MC14_BESBE|nr:hypothetical protein BESB_076830 [Besnoitia besnoiti]PFH33466.1 hypothetical protein BESB_076830 [Besnoitia besnoiti]